MVQILAIFVFIVVAALAIIHVYWGHGGNWPGSSRRELVDKVFGEGSEFPSIWACYAVAVALVFAASVALASGHIISMEILSGIIIKISAYAISLVFFLRGSAGYLQMFEKRWTPIFVRYNRRIYGPLCLGLAIGYIILASSM